MELALTGYVEFFFLSTSFRAYLSPGVDERGVALASLS